MHFPMMNFGSSKRCSKNICNTAGTVSKPPLIFSWRKQFNCLGIKNLIEKLSLTEQAKVIHADSLIYPYEKLNLIFDIVFLDPPFRKGFLNNVYNNFSKNKLLREGSLIYVESEEGLKMNFMLWKEIKKSKGGQTCYSLYKNEG